MPPSSPEQRDAHLTELIDWCTRTAVESAKRREGSDPYRFLMDVAIQLDDLRQRLREDAS